jgi:hypothetical protein
LYVECQTAQGFQVSEQQGGVNSLGFSYRVVAKRKDIAGPRFEKVESPDFSAFEKREPLDVPQAPQEVRASSGAAGPA